MKKVNGIIISLYSYSHRDMKNIAYSESFFKIWVKMHIMEIFGYHHTKCFEHEEKWLNVL